MFEPDLCSLTIKHTTALFSLHSHKRLPNHEAVRAESPDVFDYMPDTLERKFKNPCWYNKVRRVSLTLKISVIVMD